MRNNYQNLIAEDVNEFGKVGAEMSYIQSQMRSDYDSAESIADSDLEDWRIEKNAGFTTVYEESERTVNHFEYQLHPGNLLQ